ncbi:hypothetical protein [Alteromonas sp. S005]|uniref:hypothetical protein n=1 Tax=Alteromonas sp. S005 TaxID=3117400 RepID=UPI002FE061F4
MKIPLYTYFRNRTLAISGFINDKTYFASLVCAFLLVGCGGSSNDNDGVVRPDSMLGVWFGNTSTVEGGQEEVVIAVSSKGKTIVFSQASRDTLIAHGDISEGTFTSDDTMLYPGEGMTRHGTMQLTANGGSLEGSATVSGLTLNFSANKVGVTEDASLIDIAGNYSSSWSDSAYTRSFAIDNEGMISGSDTNGCVYSGSVEPISGISSLFDITIKAEVCFEDFEYEGLLAYGVFPFEYQNSIVERNGIVLAAEASSRAYAFRQFSPQD